MDLVQNEWSSGVGVHGLLLSFRSLLASPTRGDAESMPADPQAARLYLDTPKEFRRVHEAIAATMKVVPDAI